jgi:RNA polymerase sigma factor (sigma-70 family)
MYDFFYGYAMSICMRYSRSREDAIEVMNDGFLKVFRNIASFRIEGSGKQVLYPFQAWIKKIMIYTAIDRYRAQEKHAGQQDITLHEYGLHQDDHGPLDSMAYEELIGLIQLLTPAYRAVFNLYVIDGFTHEQIAGKLGISSGTSKSNLARAREALRKMLKKIDDRNCVRYGQ